MSLKRLLSFLPFARRLDSTSDCQSTSGAAMIFFSLNLLAAVWAVMLVVSAAVLLVFALLTPGVAFFGSAGARDAEIHSIKSVTDIGLLQNKAVLDVSEGYASSARATFLCHVALGALLFIIVNSVAGLLLVRWMKRHLSPADDGA
jgi:hypothetical protein